MKKSLDLNWSKLVSQEEMLNQALFQDHPFELVKTHKTH